MSSSAIDKSETASSNFEEKFDADVGEIRVLISNGLLQCGQRKFSDAIATYKQAEILFLKVYSKLPSEVVGECITLLHSLIAKINAASKLPFACSPKLAQITKSLGPEFLPAAPVSKVASKIGIGKVIPKRYSGTHAAQSKLLAAKKRESVVPPQKPINNYNNSYVRKSFTPLSKSYLAATAAEDEANAASHASRNRITLKNDSLSSITLKQRLRGMRFNEWEAQVLAHVVDTDDRVCGSVFPLSEHLNVLTELHQEFQKYFKKLKVASSEAVPPPLILFKGHPSGLKYQILKRASSESQAMFFNFSEASLELFSASSSLEAIVRSLFTVTQKLNPSILYLNCPDKFWESYSQKNTPNAADLLYFPNFLRCFSEHLEDFLKNETNSRIAVVMSMTSEESLPKFFKSRLSLSLNLSNYDLENSRDSLDIIQNELKMPKVEPKDVISEATQLSFGDLAFSSLLTSIGLKSAHFIPYARQLTKSSELDAAFTSTMLPFNDTEES